MNFFCCYVKTRKKIDKYFKVNKIKGKYVVDLKKMIDEEGISSESDKTYLKTLIFNKVQRAIEKNRDVYYIPNFDEEFSIEKLLNLKKILEDNTFNILVFYDEFKKTNRDEDLINQAFDHLSYFDNSQILRDY